MAAQHYDAVVIGAGQAGVPLSQALAGSGRSTALIEREHVGGTCINVGCTPTKTMVASAKTAYIDRRSADYGVHNGPVSVDMREVRGRKRAMVDSFRDSNLRRIEAAEGLDLISGEASFTGPRTLAVRTNDGEDLELVAENVFINAGARPANPPIEGLDEVPALNSTSIMELGELPEHLLVLGGSYVGLEFAQMFRRFGSEVTVVQRGGQLMGREDADVAEAVAEILREDGIEVLLGTQTRRAAQDDSREDRSDGRHIRRGAHDCGFSPPRGGRQAAQHRDLNLDAAGIETDKRGFIEANERLETSAPGVYALGDVKGGPAFTHISYDDFRIIRTNLLEGGSATITNRQVPYTMFIDPQLGRIGLSEQEARDEGRDVLVAKIPMSYVSRAVELGETRGFMKAVDRRRDRPDPGLRGARYRRG